MSRGEQLRQSALAARLVFLGGFAGKGLRLVTDLVLARVLGLAGFGVVAAASSLMNILGEVGLLGIHRGLLRFCSVDEAEGRARRSDRIAARAMALALGASAVIVAGVVLGREWLTALLFDEGTSPWLLPLFALCVPAIALVTVYQFRARAARRFADDTVLGNVARNGLPLLLTIAFLAMGWGVWGAAAGLVGGLALSAALGAGMQARARRASAGEPGMASADAAAPAAPAAPTMDASAAPAAPAFSHLLRVSLPLALASASILLMNELDKVMLAAFRPEEEVGLYTAAFRIARQVILILPALNAAISPSVAPMLAAGRREELADLYRTLTRWSIAAGASAALLFIAFGADFLRLFGPDYAAATGILTVLSLGYFVVAVAGNAGIVLQFSGREKLELGNGLLVTGLNIALNCALIPAYGAAGAAVATLASLTLVATRRVLQVRQVLGAGPFDRGTAGSVLVAGAGVALAALLHLAAARLGAPPPVRAAVVLAAMGAVWMVALRIKGITPAEAALLRLPRRWVRETEDDEAGDAAPAVAAAGSAGSRSGTPTRPAPEPAEAASLLPGSDRPGSASAARSLPPDRGSA